MKNRVKLLIVPVILSLTGCLSNNQNSLAFLDGNRQNISLEFQTDQSRFISGLLSSTSTLEDRESFVKEFISKSDIQCQHYLNNPNVKSEESSKKNSLYMGIFDMVSLLFGVKQITDSAKALYNNSSSSSENRDIYKDALTPEIIKAVEIGRARYAKKMIGKSRQSVDKYSLDDINRDTQAYDKQCNREYGLIEINRALKYAQQQMLKHRSSKTIRQRVVINPIEIKKRVEDATKKAQAQEKIKEKTKEIKDSEKEKKVKKQIAPAIQLRD